MANTRAVMGEQSCLDALIVGTITEFEDDEVYKLRMNSFAGNGKLTSVRLPNCMTVGGSSFINCSKLVTVDFPACIQVNAESFYRCTSLTSVNLPECTTLGMSSFYGCTALTEIVLPKCRSIGFEAFRASGLTSITLGYNGVASKQSNSLPSSFNSGGTGTVYVPASQLAAYRASSQWSNINLAAIGG